MKTERRHELQTNVLADWLGHKIEAVRPYANAILATAAILTVAVLASAYFFNDRASQNAEGWADYFAAMSERDATRLRTVAGLDDDAAWTKKRPEWALWAAQSAGDLELGRGLAALFTSADEANTALRKAKESYEKVVAAEYADPDLRQRAAFGLATYYESLGNVPVAFEKYDAVIAIKPGSVLADRSRDRKATVDRPNVVAWYRSFDPREAARVRADAATGGPQLPANLGNLPQFPDFGVDSSTETESAPPSATETAAESEETQANEVPAEGDTSAAGDAEASPAGESGPELGTPDAPSADETDASESPAVDETSPAGDATASEDPGGGN